MQVVQIRIRGQIDEHWSDWFGNLEIAPTAHGETVLRGSVPDQAALYGVLAKLRDLGLALVSGADVELGGDDRYRAQGA